MKSFLIKDTTREEREQIVFGSITSGEGSSDFASSGCMGEGSPYMIYRDYIDGKKEIAEINMEYNARYVGGH